MKLNINDFVRVKLTNHGKEILRKRHIDFVHGLGSVLSKKQMKFQLPKEDNNGYSEWQLWSLFEKFGEHIHMGCVPPFDFDIEVPDKDGH